MFEAVKIRKHLKRPWKHMEYFLDLIGVASEHCWFPGLVVFDQGQGMQGERSVDGLIPLRSNMICHNYI